MGVTRASRMRALSGAAPAAARRLSPARWLVGAVGVFALGLTASPAHALDAAVAKGRAEAEIRAVNGSTSKIQAAIKKAKQIHGVSVAKRIAAGDLLLRTKDYERAIRELSKVLELGRQGKATPAEIADAEFLLADGYFQSNQLLSARRHYRDIIDHGTEPAYSAYAG
ncbi:MAG: hypothetical protein KC492_34150, partial [Myxococcales bacterium]|nr:hypothetical protein [Myxococcales bacterium]